MFYYFVQFGSLSRYRGFHKLTTDGGGAAESELHDGHGTLLVCEVVDGHKETIRDKLVASSEVV